MAPITVPSGDFYRQAIYHDRPNAGFGGQFTFVPHFRLSGGHDQPEPRIRNQICDLPPGRFVGIDVKILSISVIDKADNAIRVTEDDSGRNILEYELWNAFSILAHAGDVDTLLPPASHADETSGKDFRNAVLTVI